MDSEHYFKIKVRRKIPYVSTILLISGLVCVLIFLAFNFLFYPFKNVDSSIQTIVFTWLYPRVWNTIYLMSLVGSLIIMILYAYLRYHKAAVLQFTNDNITIRGKAIRIIIPIRLIKQVIINDDCNHETKNRFTVNIVDKKSRVTNFYLKVYSENDVFMQQVLKYENLNLKFYELAAPTFTLDED